LSLAISSQILSDGMADPASDGSLERDIEQVSFTLISLSYFLKLFCLCLVFLLSEW